jgi:hypothetical protein
VRHHVPWYLLVALFASCMVTGVVAIVVARAGQERSERQLCSLLIAQDDAYRQTPPTTPTGLRVAAAVGQLRRAYGC